MLLICFLVQLTLRLALFDFVCHLLIIFFEFDIDMLRKFFHTLILLVYFLAKSTLRLILLDFICHLHIYLFGGWYYLVLCHLLQNVGKNITACFGVLPEIN